MILSHYYNCRHIWLKERKNDYLYIRKAKNLHFYQSCFKFALCYCNYHKQLSLIVGSKCTCKRSPLLDEYKYGHHISTACVVNRVSEIKLMRYWLLLWYFNSRHEVSNICREIDTDDVMRTDLVFYIIPGTNNVVIGDICISCPKFIGVV